MTIYDGSRYTDTLVSNNLNASSYIGTRLTTLHMMTSVGDMMIEVHSADGMYNGKQINILDYPNTETVTVDSIMGPTQSTMWDSVTQTYTTMNYYTVNLKERIKYAHNQWTTVQIPKVNYRSSMIPSFEPRQTEIVGDNTDDIVLWRAGDRLDILAYERYGDAQLGWAILDANPSYLSSLDIQVGDSVIVPSYQKVYEQLKRGG